MNDILKQYNKTISKEDFQEYAGMPFQDIMDKIVGKRDHNLIETKRRDLLYSNLDSITLSSGVEKTLKMLKDNSFKLAIASGSSREFIEKIIEKFSLQEYFHNYLSTQEVKHPKPAPDVFLKTAQMLSTDPKDCIVLEDGKSGIIGAKTAGMRTIGIIKNNSSLPADRLIQGLDELTLDDFKTTCS